MKSSRWMAIVASALYRACAQSKHLRPHAPVARFQPRYRDLAEAPDGCDTRWGHFDEPFSLNPTSPRSMDLVVDLLDDLLPHFSSRQMNAGLDEPVDVAKAQAVPP